MASTTSRPAVGTFAVHKLRIGPETFTGFAIFAAVFAFVNVAFIVQGFEDVLHGFDMIVVGGADKTVIRNVDVFPEFFEFGDHTVCIFLRGKAGGFGFVFDFLAMLVGSGQKQDIKASGAFVAGHGIAGDGGVTMPDMRGAGGIVNRSGNVKLF